MRKAVGLGLVSIRLPNFYSRVVGSDEVQVKEYFVDVVIG